MTEKTKKLIEELEKLPEKEQEGYAKSLLRDLRRRRKQKERGSEEETGELYEPFQIMLDADLDLPPDYSETHEEHLYGA
jgi:hypothetical protein